MERSDDDSSSSVTGNNQSSLLLHHHHRCHDPSPSNDVITQGHTVCPDAQRVICSGDGEEVEDLATSSGSDEDLRGPIRRCSDVMAGVDQKEGLRLRDDVTQADRIISNMEVSCWSERSCHSLGGDGHCVGGATGGSAQVDLNPLTLSDFDDDTFITESQPAELNPPTTAALSRNTFECGRRQSAPSQLIQEDGELQSRRPGIVQYFSSRKQRSVSVAGWKLFGKVPLKQSPSKQARIIQQEYEAQHVAARSSPTHHATAQQSRRKVEFEPLSTTALILEDRPPNLPAKSAEETQRHRQQYEQMVAGAKRRELKEAQRRQQQVKERVRQEEEMSNATLVWNQHILPYWDTMRSSRRTRDLWWAGLPPSVRGRVWSLSIGNELNVTAELYEIFLSRAKQKWRNVSKTETAAHLDSPLPAAGASLADIESSLELITRDISRTFPSLCVFQKGGPYHDLLQSILGVYTCYRPDVGYVQGMSSMAAMLILNMDEVEAFISFSNLINRPCQMAFYRVDHRLMLRYFGAFQVFFAETLPRLFLHFRSSGLTPDLYLMDWILSLYTKPLPLDVACRVWDVFFRDGEEFLFRTALGILRLYQDVLLHMDLINIAQFLSRLPDEELLSDRLFSCILASPMQSGNRKWSQVLSSCRDTERISS